MVFRIVKPSRTLTYAEIAAVLYRTGQTPKLLSPRQIRRIERRALKKLRSNPVARELIGGLR